MESRGGMQAKSTEAVPSLAVMAQLGGSRKQHSGLSSQSWGPFMEGAGWIWMLLQHCWPRVG